MTSTTQPRDAQGRFASNHNGGFPSPKTSEDRMAINRFFEIVDNAMLGRRELLDRFLDPRRDIDDECGYPKTKNIRSQDYRNLYDREPVATRVVEILPKETWQTTPTVFETEDPDEKTEFETRWKSISRALRGESWFQDEEGDPIWEHLMRADILSGIGSFGVILLGIDDGLELWEPAEGIDDLCRVNPPSADHELLFIRSFDESLIQILRYEEDPTNPRFGEPTLYKLDLVDPTKSNLTGVGQTMKSVEVHWTRVIHVADNLGSSEIFGHPRMLPVYNRLMDLRKLYAGSAEMYWRGAFPGLSFETNPQLGGDVTINKAALRSQIEQYMNGLQRYLSTIGMQVKSLAPQVVNPTEQINVQIEAICIRLGIPKRILIGSERGELASSQDDSTWNDRLRHRQNNYVTPRMIVPFVDRLIALGVLPEPKEGFSVAWPDLDSLTDAEQAAIAVKRTEALAKYADTGASTVMVPIDFLTRVMGMTQEEAGATVEAAMAELQVEDSLLGGSDDGEEDEEGGNEFGEGGEETGEDDQSDGTLE